MARWRGQHLPITDPVVMSNAAKRLVVHGAFVIGSATLNLAGQHRKDRLATAQRLNLTLLIQAQHQRHE